MYGHSVADTRSSPVADETAEVTRSGRLFQTRAAATEKRISIVPLNSEPGLNPKPVIGRGLCNLGQCVSGDN